MELQKVTEDNTKKKRIIQLLAEDILSLKKERTKVALSLHFALTQNKAIALVLIIFSNYD